MSVWLTEVDKAFKTYLTSLMSTLDTPSIIPVKIFNPDILTNKEEYPCVTINSLNQDFNIKMTDVNSFDVTHVGEGNRVKIEDKPSKLDLHYQIDFWSKSQNLINAMTYTWIINTPKHGLLDVVDSEGNTIQYPLTQTGYYKLDSSSEGRTTFRRSYECKVTIDLIHSKAKVVGIVQEYNLTINK